MAPKFANSADMRRYAALRTMDFGDEVHAWQAEIQDLKRQKVEALLEKASAVLKTYWMVPQGTIYDSDPHPGFLSAQITVEVLGDPMNHDEFQGIIDQVLGEGWQITEPGPHWVIQFKA